MTTKDIFDRATKVAGETSTVAEAFQIIQQLREKFDFDGFELDSSAVSSNVESALTGAMGATGLTPGESRDFLDDFGAQLAEHVISVAFNQGNTAGRMEDAANEGAAEALSYTVLPVFSDPDEYTFDVSFYDKNQRAIGASLDWSSMLDAYTFAEDTVGGPINEMTADARVNLNMVEDENVEVASYTILVCDKATRNVVVHLSSMK